MVWRLRSLSLERRQRRSAFWLKAFDGDPYSVFRKGGDLRNGGRAPVEIPHLSIGVIGSVQPEPLRTFLTNTDDGLAHRFLWMWPDRTTTFKIPRKTDVGIKADDDRAMAAFLTLDRLMTETPGEPVRVPVSAEATEFLEGYGGRLLSRAEGVSAW